MTNATNTLSEAFQAINVGNVTKLSSLIQTGLSINETNREIYLIHAAACSNQMECLLLLINAGAYIDAFDFENGMSTLMFACQNCNLMCVNILCACNANINALSKHGLSAIDYLCSSYRDATHIVPIVITLIKSGLFLNVIHAVRLLNQCSDSLLRRQFQEILVDDCTPKYPKTLLHLAVHAIRQHIMAINNTGNLFVHVDKMELPSVIRNQLLDIISPNVGV